MIVEIDEVDVVLVMGYVGLIGEGDSLVNQGFVDQVVEVGMYWGKFCWRMLVLDGGWKVLYFVVEVLVGVNLVSYIGLIIFFFIVRYLLLYGMLL